MREIPGAISQGNSREETMRNVKEAIELLLEHRASKVVGQRVQEIVVTT
ncbi:MAG TPA: type II toxin-antitoxin system HicB family antitoxin [archaeon]|nr:type II toxin-antitoxin system HicB family antitoxin [archaeon]